MASDDKPLLTAELRAALKQEILEEIAQEAEAEKQREALLAKQAELAARRDFLIEEAAKKKAREELKAGEEPWCELVGMVKDPIHGIKIELDWNRAFIDYLKSGGIEGPSEDIIIQRWLEAITVDVAADLAMIDAEKSIIGEPSEFE